MTGRDNFSRVGIGANPQLRAPLFERWEFAVLRAGTQSPHPIGDNIGQPNV